MSDNVIQFPRGRGLAPPQSIEEVQENVGRVRAELADGAIASGMMALFEALAHEGIDITAEEIHTCNALICESIRAAVYKALTLNHPFHIMVEQMIDFEYDDEGMVIYRYRIPTSYEQEEVES